LFGREAGWSIEITFCVVSVADLRTLDERVSASNANFVRVRHIVGMRVVGFETGESCVGEWNRKREFDAFAGESGIE
jgi:hypothetical protein